MPFDPTPTERPAVSRNGVELAKLRVLEEALRAEMPAKFKWDFRTIAEQRHCGTAGCAIGLAHHIGLFDPAEWSEKFTAANGQIFNIGEEASPVFGLTEAETSRVFFSSALYPAHRMSAVTPAMVADELRKIIAREEADTAP